MKKLFIVLALASISLSSMAQDAEPTLKYSVATNSFWSNWFIQVGGDFNSFISSEEHGRGFDNGDHFGLFAGDRTNIGGSLAIGKWFTPGLGLRTKVQVLKGKKVDSPNPDDFDYWIANEQVLFNLSNMLLGYNPNRVWNFIPFAGGGMARNMSANRYAMDLNVGLLNEFRLSRKVALNLEIGWNRCEPDFDGNTISGKRGWEAKDNNLYAELGLTFNLGRATWDKVPDVAAINAMHQSQIDALNAQLNDAYNETGRYKKLYEEEKNKQPEKVYVKEFVGTPVSVFFNIDKTNIASQKDLVNVQGIAKYAIDNNLGLLVTGYADSATGSAERNQWLSEERAKTVAEELVKIGVNRDKIQTAAAGGVDELSPISFNRRATVMVNK